LTLLSAAQLAAMRDTASQALPGTAVVQSSAWVSDGGGAGTTTFTAAGTIACRVAPIAAAEKVEGSRLDPDSEVLFTLEWDAGVDAADQLVYQGGTFTVTGIRAPRSWPVTQLVEAKEIT
jgi:hypothetical protein